MECVHPSTSSKDSGIIPKKEAERMHVVVDGYKKIITSENTRQKLYICTHSDYDTMQKSV